MIKQFEENGRTEFHLVDEDGYEAFAAVVNYFRSLGATITKSLDGPDTRHCELTLQQCNVIVKHLDGLGNYFYSDDPQCKPLLKQIADDMNRMSWADLVLAATERAT